MAVVAYPDSRLSLDFDVHRPVLEPATPKMATAPVLRGLGALIATRDHRPALAAMLPASSCVVVTGQAGGRDYVVIAL